jgi:hypothetical protein
LPVFQMRRIDAEGIPHQLRLFDVLRPCIHSQNISRSRLVGFQRPETFIATHIQNTQPFQAFTVHRTTGQIKSRNSIFFSSIFFVGRVNHNAFPQRKRVMPVWKRIYLFEQLCFFHAPFSFSRQGREGAGPKRSCLRLGGYPLWDVISSRPQTVKV